MPFAYAREVVVAVGGIEPPWPKRRVYSAPLIHTGLHRQTKTGRDEGSRTLTVSHQALDLTRLPFRHVPKKSAPARTCTGTSCDSRV